MNFRVLWGECEEVKPGTLELRAPRDTPDGIGSCLVAVKWDGHALRMETERVDSWRPEPWADLWFMARESEDADPWPMRYVRCTKVVGEIGESLGGRPEDQRIHMTFTHPEVSHWSPEVVVRETQYRVSHSGGALHVGALYGTTLSVPAPVCELLLYCEASVVRVTVAAG